MIKVGAHLPQVEFEMTKASGLHSFKEFLGKTLVLYFYPKDDTSGCTLQAQGFRDQINAFSKAGAVVIGVSKDNLKSHQKFCDKYELPFDLITDVATKLCGLFDVIKEKSMYGRKYMGIERSTFVIDKNGVLVKEWRKVSVPGHVDEVLAFVEAL